MISKPTVSWVLLGELGNHVPPAEQPYLPHQDMAQIVMDECRLRGWEVLGERFVLTANKQDVVGSFQLCVPGAGIPPGFVLAVGLANSYSDRSRSRLYVGATEKSTSTTVVTAEVVLPRRLKEQFDPHAVLLKAAVRQCEEEILRLPDAVSGWKGRMLGERELEHLLITAGRQRVLPWERIGMVDKQYHAGKGRNVWTLLGAFSHVVKRSPAHKQMGLRYRFGRLLPRRGELVTTMNSGV